MSDELRSSEDGDKSGATFPRIWKISQSAISNQEILKNLKDSTVVAINGRDGYGPGEYFRTEIRVNDYFYLYSPDEINSKHSKIQFFGRFKKDALPSPYLEGWYQREYEFIYPAISDKKYPYPQKGSKNWEPNGQIACWKVGDTDDELFRFEERILQPYFGKRLSDLAGIKSIEDRTNMYANNNVLVQQYSSWLRNSHNIILRGAPGTGKTYLAHQIATDIASDGKFDELSPEQQKQIENTQIEFVQFHPSYDYTDFVEGLRPCKNKNGGSENDGSIGFELQDGIFKKFVDRARYARVIDFLSGLDRFETLTNYETISGSKFRILNPKNEIVDKIKTIEISIQDGERYRLLSLSADNLIRMLESDKEFAKELDVASFFGSTQPQDDDSCYLKIYDEVRKTTNDKKYVFIIDEINRGEISKIFGELFFSIDPGYRGESGKVKTQYANLHDDKDKWFYIPDNVYIIGTMNDIDRSVDSFDFAMRRRFRFIEITADDAALKTTILDELGESEKTKAISRMRALNKAISDTEGLNANYHIGPAYFLRLKDVNNNYDTLWTDFLEPLLQEYVRGMSGEDDKLKAFKDAYNPKNDSQKNNEQPDDSGEKSKADQTAQDGNEQLGDSVQS